MAQLITQSPPESEINAEDDIPLCPSDMLLNLIVSLLAPMFLGPGGGNIAFARMAATDTVNAYRIRTKVDLIFVAQIIAFGLGALGSLSLSMLDNLTLSMTLRLRSNANACDRSAERNRRALLTDALFAEVAVTPSFRPDPGEAQHKAAAVTNVVAVQQPVANVQADMQIPAEPLVIVSAAAPTKVSPPVSEHTQAPFAAPLSPPTAAGPRSGRDLDAMWATAMIKVAAELRGGLGNLPLVERRETTMKASALGSCAQDLLLGNSGPRLRPGDLDLMMKQKRG